jgi:hypothetical protein
MKIRAAGTRAATLAHAETLSFQPLSGAPATGYLSPDGLFSNRINQFFK